MNVDFNIEDIKYVKWYVPLELNHSSYVYTAVTEFIKKFNKKLIVSTININKKGKIVVANNDIHITNAWYTKVSFVEFFLKNNTKKLYAFDCSDSPYDFPLYALNNADLVFKRSYILEYVEKLDDKLRTKVVPMGIPFMVKPDNFYFKTKIKLLYFFFRCVQLIKMDRLFFKRILNYYRTSISHWNNFNKTRTLFDFNKRKTEIINHTIFYQKRLFPNENDMDTKQIHKQRVSIIRLLKKRFPDNFVGGLKYDQPMTDNFSDCISNIDGDPQVFLDTVNQCGICVYTRGLTLSTGWTLPEFLSQGKFILAEKSKTIFPNPLMDDVHLKYFESEEELADLCEYYLNNTEERNRISNNGFEYYSRYINPTIFIENTLFNP